MAEKLLEFRFLVGGKPANEAGIKIGGKNLTDQSLNLMQTDERKKILNIISMTHSQVEVFQLIQKANQ